ncbi:MAG: hypothetical protein IKY33_02440 [Clostridia bacterium]|nr:hypothetical protein [Clostridia bacterium]
MVNTFLAANTERGFYSLFDEMTSKTDHNILLIKGGPGTGKSSLMKKISTAAEQKGYQVEQIHCSSDPDSLDGVWIKDKKLILLDATSPHCVDPKYPGAVEQILPLGELWDRSKLIPHKQEIIALSQSISGLFTQVYKMLSAMGEVSQMANKIILSAFDRVKAEKTLRKLFGQQALVPLGKKAKIQNRFISALSCKGTVLYEDILQNTRCVVLIEDSYDGAHLLTNLAEKILDESGYDRIRLLSPLCPQQIDHLILPECSLAIVTQNHRLKWQSEMNIIKTLSVKSFLNGEIISANKNKLSFVKKMNKTLSDEVSEYLASEKALHDKLEKYYIDAMDFDALNRQSQQIIAQYL